MLCHNCHTALRTGARFCNNCGARQVAIDQLPTAPAARPEAAAPAALASGESGPRQGSAASGAGGRLPRPPRVPRGRDTAEGQHQAPWPADVASPEQSEGDVAAIADAETVKQGAVSARKRPVDTVPLARRDSGGTKPLPPDGLPWPLPVSIIVGGRYRVESLISTGPADQGAENVYLVSDLQGYERCWSCQATHGPEATTLTICPECGVDMLDRDYVLRERLVSAGEPKPANAGSAADQRVFAQGQRFYRVSPRTDEMPRFPRGVHVIAGVASDPGRGRPGEPNQDSQGLLLLEVVADSRSLPVALAVVADGLGGHESGLEASQLAVRTLVESVLRVVLAPHLGEGGARLDGGTLEHLLRSAVQGANAALCQMNEARGSDAGSTLVAALIVEETAYIANVGDSRAYVLGREGLKRVTTDHSLVEQFVAGGIITDDQRYHHPKRNQILRSLGEASIEVDLFTLKLRPGMRLLLCSDGLWEMVRAHEMARILTDTPHPQMACDALVRAANEHGGEDNISAVVIEAFA